jgi:hypothetical protein
VEVVQALLSHQVLEQQVQLIQVAVVVVAVLMRLVQVLLRGDRVVLA